MSSDWTEKYRPRTLSGVIGNQSAVGELLSWARSWEGGRQTKNAVVLLGPPGIGKTTSAEALANDMGWDIIEMNASDQRTGEAIKQIALRGAYSNSFDDSGAFLSIKDGKRKLIVLDEADSLFGSADRGALPAIVELIKKTRQPVMLIVNDFYALSKKSSVIKSDTLQISFRKPVSSSIAKVLKGIADNEGVAVSPAVLTEIAENANGDMRAAVRDLESVSLGKTTVGGGDISSLSDRDKRSTMYDLLYMIFRKSDAMGSRDMIRTLDEDPEFTMLWLDHNMPNEYIDSGDLVRGYERLSRADIFLGRVYKRQYYRFWAYANDTMTAGVCVARHSNKVNRNRFEFPTYLMKMSRSKSVRAMKSSLCLKLAEHLHTSTRRVSMDILPSLKLMLIGDAGMRAAMISDVGLEPEELAFLINKKIESREVKDAVAAANAVTVSSPADEKPVVAAPEPKVAPAEPVKVVPPKSQKSLFDF